MSFASKARTLEGIVKVWEKQKRNLQPVSRLQFSSNLFRKFRRNFKGKSIKHFKACVFRNISRLALFSKWKPFLFLFQFQFQYKNDSKLTSEECKGLISRTGWCIPKKLEITLAAVNDHKLVRGKHNVTKFVVRIFLIKLSLNAKTFCCSNFLNSLIIVQMVICVLQDLMEWKRLKEVTERKIF